MPMLRARLRHSHPAAYMRRSLIGILLRYKAERMTGWIADDSRSARRWLVVELRRTQSQHTPLGCVYVIDPKVQVDLH